MKYIPRSDIYRDTGIAAFFLLALVNVWLAGPYNYKLETLFEKQNHEAKSHIILHDEVRFV